MLLLTSGTAQAAPIGAPKQHRLPTADSAPRDITNGSDGNRWFTETSEFLPATIGRITPSGDVTEFGPAYPFGILTDIAQGPGGILYYTSNDPILGRVTTSGEFLAVVPLPQSNASAATSRSMGVRSGSPTSTATTCGATTPARASSPSSPFPSRPTSRWTTRGPSGSRRRSPRRSAASTHRPAPCR